MSDENSILGTLDAANLQVQGLLGQGHTPGVKRIHKRRLNRSSEEEYRYIPLEINPSSAAAVDAFATIPTALISYDTLCYLGLSTRKVNEIWGQWTNWPATGPRREIDSDSGGLQVTFFDFITARFDNYQDVYVDDDVQWRDCLTMCGVNDQVQDAIMDPVFKHIRLTKSCIFWVKDTIAMRYAGLEDIRRASRQREMELARGSSRPGSSGTGSRPGGQGGSAQQSGSSESRTSSHARRSVSSLQQQAMPGISSILWNSETALELTGKPGLTVLFKGMDQARIAGLFNDSGEVVNIQKLLSPPPSDFSGTTSLFYFTNDYRVAEYYSAYAKRRANCESVVMVSLTFPDEAINNLEEPEIQRLYWPTPQWKQLVWRSKTARSLPKPLRKYRNALLIIGTISKGTERVFEDMETWEDMTDECVLRVGPTRRSNPAVQYVFSGQEEGREFIEEHGKIEVFGFSETELQALLARYR